MGYTPVLWRFTKNGKQRGKLKVFTAEVITVPVFVSDYEIEGDGWIAGYRDFKYI
jgi:hypothetical protein